MAVLQDLIVSVRNRRAELKAEPKLKVPIQLFVPNRRFVPSSSRIAAQSSAKQRRADRLQGCFAAKLPEPAYARFDVHVVTNKR